MLSKEYSKYVAHAHLLRAFNSFMRFENDG